MHKRKLGDSKYTFVFHFPYRKWVNVRVILMQTKRHLRDIRSDTNLAKLASLDTHTQDSRLSSVQDHFDFNAEAQAQ